MLETARMTNGSLLKTARRRLAREPKPAEQREGTVARIIENATSRLPSDIFLWAALGAMGWSAFQYARNNTQQSHFVGQWAPAFLLLGIYNKLVKQSGHHRATA